MKSFYDHARSGAMVIFGLLMLVATLLPQANAADRVNEYRLAAGDVVHIKVFQNPDLEVEPRVSESGTITFPLIGLVAVGDLTIAEAESLIAARLKSGGFVKNPQVSLTLTAIVGNQVAVLGQVNKPGSYPLLTFNTRLSQMLSTAGGIAQTGSETVVITGTRDGKPFRTVIDIGESFLRDKPEKDILMAGGDTVYVPRAEVFYIYGEVQRPGSYPLQRDMTVLEALAQGGGLTARGTQRSLTIFRHAEDGKVVKIKPMMNDPVLQNDVLNIGEALF